MYAGISSAYLPTISNGGRYRVRCDAYRNGALIPGGRDLTIFSGSVTDESRPGIKMQLGIELLPEPGETVDHLFDLLAPTGTELRVRSTLLNTGDVVPMGRFDVASQNMGYGSQGTLSLQADDKWVKVQRARFLTPFASTPGATITAQIVTLIRGALGSSEPVNVTATSTALMGKVVWELDRDKAIIELAESIGAWVYFDRDGVATVADVPVNQPPVWDDVPLLSASRSRDRSKTYNVVVVNPEKVDGTALFSTVTLQDTNPDSPTYVGGAFGVVPTFYSSPLLQNSAQAGKAGRAILNRVKGLNSQLTLSTVRNHALDVLDTIQVQLPRTRWDTPGAVELHMVDKIVHPLTPEDSQSIDTRATRTDDVTE
jgi:hypothetical protein